MDKEQDLLLLLQKYAEKRCTPEEELRLHAWYEKIGEGVMAELPAAEQQQKMWRQLHASMRFQAAMSSARVKTVRRSWPAIAAAAVLIMVLAGFYMIHRPSVSEQSPFALLETKGAGIKRAMLPDGSVVWLNANTRLYYSPQFATNREVRLEGEAFFDVVADPLHPFTVETQDHLKTTVLGTSFNINSYPGVNCAGIAVLSGKVSVEHTHTKQLAIITAHHAILYNKTDGSYLQTTAQQTGGWIRGEWQLNGKGTGELALLLYNQFNIQLVNKCAGLDTLQFNANFTSKQTAEEIVSTYCVLAGCHYRWRNKTEVVLY